MIWRLISSCSPAEYNYKPWKNSKAKGLKHGKEEGKLVKNPRARETSQSQGTLPPSTQSSSNQLKLATQVVQEAHSLLDQTRALAMIPSKPSTTGKGIDLEPGQEYTARESALLTHRVEMIPSNPPRRHQIARHPDTTSSLAWAVMSVLTHQILAFPMQRHQVTQQEETLSATLDRTSKDQGEPQTQQINQANQNSKIKTLKIKLSLE